MPLAESAPTAALAPAVRLALDCLPDPTLVLDVDDMVVAANAAFGRMTGFPSSEFLGVPLSELGEPAGPAGLALFRQANGGFAPARVTVRRMAGELGARYRLARLDEEETRRSLVDELSAGLEVKSEFMARVAHELRTPLTALQEGIEVVLEGLTGPLNEQQIEFLELAKRNVLRLSRLVHDTLELGDLKRGDCPRPFRVADLEAIVRQCAQRYEDAHYEPRQPVWILADGLRIRDCVDRLIQNAVRHSGSRVCVTLLEHDGDAIVAVADSGPGIPPKKLEAIFDEFEQLSVGPGRTVGGVGLGLPIVKLVIEQHGGRIWVNSEPGQGACFYLALKTCPAPAEIPHDHCDTR